MCYFKLDFVQIVRIRKKNKKIHHYFLALGVYGVEEGVVVVVSVFSQLPVFTFFSPLWWCADFLCLLGCQLQARRKAWPALPTRSWAVPPYPLPRQQFLTRFSCFPLSRDSYWSSLRTQEHVASCVFASFLERNSKVLLASNPMWAPEAGVTQSQFIVSNICFDNCLLLFTTELHSAKLNYKVLSQALTHPKYPFVTALEITETA